ncbi:MAG: hypothetical protein JXB62_02175 [Pirellulales bacterium]|nr:hypothetical protein [Pirellulales bacterium]
MTRISKLKRNSGLAALLIALSVHVLAAPAAAAEAGDLTPDDVVRTLEVTIQVSDQGDDLDEPIALDLGLGFPLWLYPVGWSAGQDVPFGAVAQESSAGAKIQAGSQAVFTFDVAGKPGQDVLGTTPQLLAGVLVSDVRRIGFASPRTCDWVLEGYRLKVNGVDFAEDNRGVPQPDAEQTALSAKAAQLDQDLAALRKEYDRLRSLDKDKATDADRQRITQIETEATKAFQQKATLESRLVVNPKSAKATRERDLSKVTGLVSQIQTARQGTVSPPAASAAQAQPAATAAAPSGQDSQELLQAQAALDALLSEKRLVEGQIQSVYPWFVDDRFRPLVPMGSSSSSSVVKKIDVTLETHTHAGADTQNYVYLSTGGHKYLLNSRYLAVSASAGPQQFQADLLAGPLAAARLRGWGVGVLATPDSQGAAPDRWHPQRVLIDVDGTGVYDSEDSPLDRQSLEAVRIIPPAQRDDDGKPLANPCSAREVYLWQAGQGLGLDLIAGGASQLPDSSDPGYPEAEPGLSDAPDSQAAPDTSGSSPDFPLFPGEDSGYADAGSGGGSYGEYGGGYADSGSGGSGSGSGGSGGGSSNTANPPPPPPPPPLGPFSMKEVWISKGWKINEPFVVDWKVTGDTGEIDHFLVSLRVVRPDQTKNLFRELMQPAKVAVSQRSCVALIDSTITIPQPYYYVAPCVTAVPKDPTKNNPQSHAKIGPARAVFPDSANHDVKPLPKDVTVAGAGGSASMIAPGPPAAGATARAWFVTHPETTDARRIGPATPGAHVAVRVKQGDKVTVRCEVTKAPGKGVPFLGKQQLVAHVGYMGSTTGGYSVDVEMVCTLIGQGGAKKYDYPSWKGTVTTGTPLTFLDQLLDAADLGLPVEKAEIKFTFDNGGSADPKCTPGIFGLRMFPVSQGTAKPIHADLVIDQSNTYLVPGELRLVGERKTLIYKPLCLAITNDGPDAIPGSVLRDVKVQVKYYLGQYGKAWGDIKDPANRAEITCGPFRVTEVRELTTGGKWQGALNPGQTMRLVPTPPPGHPWLDPDGKLRSTKKLDVKQRNAHKLFQSSASIQSSGATSLDDPSGNNAWPQKFSEGMVIGQGPLDFEFLAFQEENHQGIGARYELNPDTHRQRSIWDLANVPDRPDMYQKIVSIMVGRKIDVYPRGEHHFYEAGGRCLEDLYRGGTSNAFVRSGAGQIGSAVICNKKNNGPIGVWTRSVSYWRGPRGFFFPLADEPGGATTVKVVKKFESFMDNDVDWVHFWPGIRTGGSPPTSWLKVTLYENANEGGKSLTFENLPSGFLKQGINAHNGALTLYRVNLHQWGWNGYIGPVPMGDIGDVISSLKMELKGSAVK